MNKDTITNCLLGGAIGDALGAPWEFRSDCTREMIEAQADGFSHGHHVTDDTQMMLFTLEACIEHLKTERNLIECCWDAYRRWLLTQQGGQQDFLEANPLGDDLLHQCGMWALRAPGNTCLSALAAGVPGRIAVPPNRPINNSKGCGGVMRVAPIAFVGHFAEACASAALTHGHVDGWLPAGALCEMIEYLSNGNELRTAAVAAWRAVQRFVKATSGTSELLYRAVANYDIGSRDVTELGQGWTGDEALAIGLLAALYGVREGAMAGYAMAVAHPGDSDSTGLIAGVLMGAAGVELPQALVEQVEHGPLIKKMAAELAERIC
jgi:ADP-ribosylglycohydrolase